MKKRMFIWHIDASPVWPVGNAGAVIVASTAKEAVKLGESKGLYKASAPIKVGFACSKYKRAEVIFSNTGDY